MIPISVLDELSLLSALLRVNVIGAVPSSDELDNDDDEGLRVGYRIVPVFGCDFDCDSRRACCSRCATLVRAACDAGVGVDMYVLIGVEELSCCSGEGRLVMRQVHEHEGREGGDSRYGSKS
jgi:hypothetical protein